MPFASFRGLPEPADPEPSPVSTFTDYVDYDAVGLLELLRRGQVSAAEVLEAALDRIAAFEPEVNAIAVPMADYARKAVADGLPFGAASGVPFLVKDIDAGNVAGIPNTMSSRLLLDNAAARSSESVERYLASGMVILGRSAMPNFGVCATTEPVLYGPTRNPWDLGRSAGGSTGGGAAAVAIGMVPVAQATDAAGSLRLPASHCGLFGLKPSRGRVSAGPDAGEHAGGMGAVHVVSRSVRDSALMLDVVAGAGIGDPYVAPPPLQPYAYEILQGPGRLRIAYSVAPPAEGMSVDAECVRAVEEAAKLCESLGHTVEQAAPVFDFRAMVKDFVLIHSAAMSSRVERMLAALGRAPRPDEIEPAALGWARLAQGRNAAALADAYRLMHAITRTVARFMTGYDIFLTPTAAQPALPIGALSMLEPDFDTYLEVLFGHMAFTTLANVTGMPAMSVPLHWTEAGLPVGPHFMASYGAEDILFRLAAQLEQAKPWAHRRPPLWT